MNATLTTLQNSTIVRTRTSWWAAVRAYFAIVSRLVPGLARRQAERLFTLPPRYSGRRVHPVDARRETVVAGKHSLAVWQAGPAAAPGVLLVHGWVAAACKWAALSRLCWRAAIASCGLISRDIAGAAAVQLPCPALCALWEPSPPPMDRSQP